MQVTLGSNGRFWVTLTPDGLIPAVGILREKFSIIQLAVIVGEDVRDAFLGNYVFTGAKSLCCRSGSTVKNRKSHRCPRSFPAPSSMNGN